MPNSKTNTRSSRFYGCASMGCAGMLVCWLIGWPAYFFGTGGKYIGSLPKGQTYTSTKFEFRYGRKTRHISDPFNQLQWVYGGLPDSITVTNGQRLIVYDEPKAVIKSSKDSVDVQETYTKHKGYMGIFEDGTHYTVDRDGIIK
jgi:hypothetical protein